MRNAFAPILRARPCPIFGRPVRLRGRPHRLQPDTSPHALRIPDRSGHPALRDISSSWLQVRLGRVRLSPSCPFRLLHTRLLSRPARRYPRFRIRPSSSERRGDFNPHDSRAAQRTLRPLRHPRAPSLSLAGVWLVIPDHALGLPVLRTLSLCTCCRHYPGAAAGRRPRSSHPAVTAFPDNVVGSACTSTFSRIAQRSLALRPARSRGHLYVTSYDFMLVDIQCIISSLGKARPLGPSILYNSARCW